MSASQLGVMFWAVELSYKKFPVVELFILVYPFSYFTINESRTSRQTWLSVHDKKPSYLVFPISLRNFFWLRFRRLNSELEWLDDSDLVGKAFWKTRLPFYKPPFVFSGLSNLFPLFPFKRDPIAVPPLAMWFLTSFLSEYY